MEDWIKIIELIDRVLIIANLDQERMRENYWGEGAGISGVRFWIFGGGVLVFCTQILVISA